MKCAWQEFLSVLPLTMRSDVDRLGKTELQELRLRLGLQPELVCTSGSYWLPMRVRQQELQFVVNVASQYSPWLAETLAQGYLTAPGGHRIGVCGEAVVKNGKMEGFRRLTSLCIRVSRDFRFLNEDNNLMTGSVLIIGKPGSGKTTFLRDLVRIRSDYGDSSVAVVDERGEIFPFAAEYIRGKRTDVILGCSKKEGIEIVLRTMGPESIAVDEITSELDCKSLLQAAWCGVSLIATAHAATKYDLYSRAVYKPLVNAAVFDKLVILQKDKSWELERME